MKWSFVTLCFTSFSSRRILENKITTRLRLFHFLLITSNNLKTPPQLISFQQLGELKTSLENLVTCNCCAMECENLRGAFFLGGMFSDVKREQKYIVKEL